MVWPADMRIEVLVPEQLEFLLFARSALKLSGNGVPPLDHQPDGGNSYRLAPSLSAQLDIIWIGDWQRTFQQFEPLSTEVRPPDFITQHLLDTVDDEDLWEAVSGTSEVWDTVLDLPAYYAWLRRWRIAPQVPVGYESERRALPAVIAAWQTGLTTIIDLPYRGYFADRISTTHLLVSSQTRRYLDSYSRALATPAP